MNIVTRIRQIDSDVLDVLANAEISGNALAIKSQLDRDLYIRTNKVLEALGGKWSRAAKAHLFTGDVGDLVEEAVLTGTFSKTKQDFGAFFTPASLAGWLVGLAEIQPYHRVLEPSAGDGALLRAIGDGPDKVAVEIQPALVEKLARSGISGLHVIQEDFLKLDPAAPFPGDFDRVVMNPPFAKRADIHHIRHAHKFLRHGGKLVAIASASVAFRSDQLASNFRAWVADHDGNIEPLPPDSFKESGTGVNTVTVTMGA